MKRMLFSLVAVIGCGAFAAPAMAGGPCRPVVHFAHCGYGWHTQTYVVPAGPAACAPVRYYGRPHCVHYVGRWRHCR